MSVNFSNVSDPNADPVALTVSTYDRVVGDYVRRNDPSGKSSGRLERFAALFDVGGLEGTARILDAGCGPGWDSAWFHARGFQVVGVDLSEGMLAEARRRAPTVEFRRADLRALDFPAASFDGIWCSACLLHLDRSDVPGVLGTFKRLLRPGWLYLAVKEGEGEEINVHPYGTGNPRRFTYYARDEIEERVREAGFVVRDVVVGPSNQHESHAWIGILARTSE